jgi:MYXO-CTERM domain-containing protein
MHPSLSRWAHITAIAVIVILVVAIPRPSEAQTPTGALVVGPIQHRPDGTITTTVSGSADALASLEAFVDGAPATLEVSSNASSGPARVVLAIENSVSMTALQLGQLRAAIGDLVAALDPADEVAIVTFGNGAAVALEPTADRGAVTAALDVMTVAGGSALYSGIATAAELAAGSPSLVVVVTYGWEWGALSTHTRDASSAALVESGAAVYVQSMVFDGIDVAYLTAFATDGTVHYAAELGSLASAATLLDSGAEQHAVTVAAPPLALGAHELQLVAAGGDVQHTTSFEVTNEGWLSLAVTTPEDGSAPITVAVSAATSLDGVNLTGIVAGRTLTADGAVFTLDPWAFEAGTATFSVAATVDGAPAGEVASPVSIPVLQPLLSVTGSADGDTLTATFRSQTDSDAGLVAIAGGQVVAQSDTATLTIATDGLDEVTVEARSANGSVLASETVSPDSVPAPVAVGSPTGDQGSGGLSPPGSTMSIAAMAALALVALIVARRRRAPAASTAEARTAREWIAQENARTEAAPVTPEAEPLATPAPPAVTATRPAPAPVAIEPPHPVAAKAHVDWEIAVRAPGRPDHRVPLTSGPISIGASQLCDLTLEGDSVRFVHLVIAREGDEVRAHLFGPVTIDGGEGRLEDQIVAPGAVLGIGDITLTVETAPAHAFHRDAAA